MFTEFDIMLLSKYSIKSNIWKMSVNRKILAEYYFKIYEIDPYFYKNCKEKIKVDKNGHEDIPFRINVYFSEYKLEVHVDEKGHIERDLIFEKERQEAL